MTPPEPPAVLSRLFVVLLACAAAAPGCAFSRWNRNDPQTFSQKRPCRLSPDATAEDLLLAVNENVDRLQAWRARKVKIRANHLPMPLEGDLVVQQDRHLRLVVRHPLGAGDELDLGCNEDVFWFWARRQKPPMVMYASHDQLDLVRENLQIPFEPDWLMEALGVAPIAPEGVTVEPIPEQRAARLVSQHQTPNGRSLRKAVTVDTCHGRVLAHTVWDSATGNRLAHAEFSKHQLDPSSGVVMPHRIKLEWQQAELSLTMDLGEVEINPTDLPQRIWEMPHPPHCPLVNLEDFAEGRPQHIQPAQRSPRATATAAANGESDEQFWQPRPRSASDGESAGEFEGEFDQAEPIEYDAEPVEY